MNLYLVTCVCEYYSSHRIETLIETLDVYVVATNPTQASEMALVEMRKRKWKWDRRVNKIELIASDGYRGDAPALLVLEAEAKPIDPPA